MKAKIRARVWLACLGALLVMAAAIYLVLGHEGGASLGAPVEHPALFAQR